MAVNGEVTSSRVVTRRFHARDMVSVSDARHVLADVGPGGAAVSTDLNVAVVSSDPQYAWDLRRLRHRHDVTVSGITVEIGRASCRERGKTSAVAGVSIKKVFGCST